MTAQRTNLAPRLAGSSPNQFRKLSMRGAAGAHAVKNVSAAAADLFEIKSTAARDIRQDMEVLASDGMRGRGSATEDEARAGRYVADQLKKAGVQPFDGTHYIQDVPVRLPSGRDLLTRNVIGMLPGSDPKLKEEVVLLTAHLDHLGVDAVDAQGQDTIYNGADDDASGITAVLELARTVSQGDRLKRTVMFALFGCEEIGGYGNKHFLAHPPVPLSSIVENLEFEMIGRPDAAVKSDELWLTGYSYSNLGPELAKHGAKLVDDPHPKEKFFRRSDNYALALKGIVAHTVSSFGLHKDYHQKSDDPSRIDYDHMTDAIVSMAEPVRWLANSSFKPQWNPGMDPSKNPPTAS